MRDGIDARIVILDGPHAPLFPGGPTLADAWAYNAQVARERAQQWWAENKDPQFWKDAAERYSWTMLLGTTAPGEAPIPAGQMRRFHVTDPANLATIEAHGIRPSGTSVFSWPTLKEAETYAGGSKAIVEFHDDPAVFHDNPLAAYGSVPRENIVGVHSPGWPSK